VSEVIKDGTGRVLRTRELDDRFELFPIIMTAPVNARGTGTDFQEVWRTADMQRARAGHVTFSFNAEYDDVTRTFANLYLEVNVLGYVGNSATVVMYTTIDMNTLAEFEWDDPETYSNLAFEVRQNIDGVVTPVTTGIVSCFFNVQGGYWR
jgi:hypothetical protein